MYIAQSAVTNPTATAADAATVTKTTHPTVCTDAV